jgi:hypothetical protein
MIIKSYQQFNFPVKSLIVSILLITGCSNLPCAGINLRQQVTNYSKQPDCNHHKKGVVVIRRKVLTIMEMNLSHLMPILVHLRMMINLMIIVRERESLSPQAI